MVWASASPLVSLSGKTPLRTRCWRCNPKSASSSWVRETSLKADRWARETSTMRVWFPSASASTAALYWLCCFSRPAKGPRQEAPPGFSSMKLLHAPGSWSIRMVWPVGAVSKTIWSYSSRNAMSVRSAVNSSNAAISVVHAPDSCSSIPATTSSGSSPRTGSISFWR